MNQKKSRMILLAAALLLAAGCFGIIFAAETTPGSAADPVVSKSYMDAQIEVLQTQINVLTAKVDQLEGSSGGGGGGEAESEKFVVVKVDAGKKLIGVGSTEIILRSGTATAIAGASGGVADITGGTDLATGVSVTKNHLLLIPADDGRGIHCTATCYVMVKGAYTLQ